MGASKKLTVAEYLSSLIDLSDKTQAEIAKEANLGRPNVVSMLKNGTTKVPLHKAPGLAKVLKVDPTHFTMRCLREYYPQVAEALEEAGIEPVSQNERDILNTIREASNETDPGLNQDRRDALFSAFGGN
jgi:transcriptional regulator with XRE-family HTH domain